MVVLKSNLGIGDCGRAMRLGLVEAVVLIGDRRALSGLSTGVRAALTFHDLLGESTV